MLSIERQEMIIDLINEKKKITVCELSKILKVSLNTVRSDIAILEKNGIVTRVHGGITLPISNKNATSNNIGIRFLKNIHEKRKIAQLVVLKLKNMPNYSLFMDSSTSSLEVAEQLLHIHNHSGTIITNFINIVQILEKNTSISSIMCGGQWWSIENCTVGFEASNTIANYHCDIALIGCTAIDMKSGIFNGCIEVIPIKQQMIKNAKETWLLCDSTKFDQYALLKIADLSQISKIFTDKKPSDEWLEYCRQESIEIIYQ